MKKFLAMLVAAMMVLSLVAIPVFADGEVVFAVENAPATATPGDEITVNLTVNGTFEAHVLNMQFNYNADAFEYVSHTRGDVLNQIIDLGGTQLVDATTIPGSMRLGVMMPTAAFTQSGTICSVTLRVKEGAANGASDLALVITEFKNFPTGGQATPIANVVNNATVTITGGSEPTPVPPTENPVTPEPGTATGWGFETDPFAEGWTIRDDDGDGYNWEWMDASASDYNVYEGTHCMASASYQNSAFGGGTALTPDNWLISPAFTAGSTVTFWYAGQDPSYAAETFGVYVIANGTTSDELAYFTASGTYQQGSVDISDFAGQTVQVAFRHYDITDMFRLNLDLVEVSGGGSIPNTPVPPTDAPITDAPITDAPITDAPITEAPITEAPITDEPVTPAPGDVIFSVGGVHYVAAGSQVNVDLTINGEYEANGMNIWVQYDAENLTLNNVENGEIMNAIGNLGGMNILDFTSIPGSVRLGSMLPTNPVSGSGTIFTMNFTVAEGLEDGTELPIEILVKEFFNMPVGGENTPIAFFAENGAIVVGSEPIVTDEPGVTDEPTAVPTDAPNPPITGAMSLIGVGIAAIVASAGVVIFRKKEED
ncbi:MAG: choice-of-anchor J domain-containing protein [Clostridium sp.]|nr:choice-of-anchor J domain-containing protein [Clostridium sp.]